MKKRWTQTRAIAILKDIVDEFLAAHTTMCAADAVDIGMSWTEIQQKASPNGINFYIMWMTGQCIVHSVVWLFSRMLMNGTQTKDEKKRKKNT